MHGSYLFKSLYNAEAALVSYFPRVRRLRYNEGKYVVLAAMPKSGSTFLSNAMALLLGYRHSYFAFAYHNVEQELYLPRLLDAFGEGTVVQQHFKANEPNLQLLREFDIKPVVLVRDLYDIVVSVRDHLLNERMDNLPSLYLTAAFRQFDAQKQLDFVITFYAPWLVSFYVSWVEAQRRGLIDFLWMSYEECCTNWQAACEKIADYCGASCSSVAVAEAIEKTREAGNTRFNKGVVARGRHMLTAKQKAQILDIANMYPDIDFSRVGVPAP